GIFVHVVIGGFRRLAGVVDGDPRAFARGRSGVVDGGFHSIAQARNFLVAHGRNAAQQLFHIVEELLQLAGLAAQYAFGLVAQIIGQVFSSCSHGQTLLLDPSRNVTSAMTRKITNRILAIPAALAAIPVKPKTAAISAITKNTTA